MPACVECDEVVTQPLCPGCLSRGVASWLQEKVPERPELLLQLQDLTEESVVSGETTCIKCGSPMGLCSACYTNGLHMWMKRALPLHAAEFLALFSLDPAYAHLDAGIVRPLRVQAV
jgi:hypothetical protein